MSENPLEKCQEILGFRFNDLSMLEQALTHASLDDARSDHNERLEFLGDAILGLIVCDHLFHVFSDLREGDLTRIKSVVVSRTTLAKKVRETGLDEFIRVGKGMAGRHSYPRSVLANVFEAIVAAIYIDAGLDEARRFVLRFLVEEIGKVVSDRHERNFKDILQQYTQRHLGCAPKYKILSEHGPDHMKSFKVVATIREREYCVGQGRNKKEAEQIAAMKTYNQLHKSIEAATKKGFPEAGTVRP